MYKTELCESCRQSPVEIVVPDNDQYRPYHVCLPCNVRLQAMALRPLEWFNLASVHGPWRYLLHDDFYSDNGIADQSEEPVVDADRYPAPTLDDVANDLERLIDYSFTCHFYANDVGSRFRSFQPSTILQAIKDRVAAGTNVDIAGRILELCANTVGSAAESWVREQWSTYRRENIWELAEATAACLPFDEGFERVIAELEQADRRALSLECFCLAPFRSCKSLDWMESHTDLIQHENWGRVAALSHFTWPRAKSWLNRGRPLSFRALEAIIACYWYDTRLLKDAKPILEDPAPTEDMLVELAEYSRRDAVPNVRKKIEAITRFLIGGGSD